eukprot:5199233-Alexandrium_andersonii.AAC.1
MALSPTAAPRPWTSFGRAVSLSDRVVGRPLRLPTLSLSRTADVKFQRSSASRSGTGRSVVPS